MGRAKKELNQEILEKLMQMCCTLREIANFFDVCEDIIEARCKEMYGMTYENISEKFHDDTRISLRRKQLQLALDKGNVAMLIFLGKQMLGQSDKTEQEVKFDGNIDIGQKFNEHCENIFRRFNPSALS